MSYDDLVGAIGEGGLDDPKRILALPDGSVDDCYTVGGLDGEAVGSRGELGRQLLEGDGETFTLEHRETRPGGQAVNAARQAHALGEDPLLVGHLDHPVLGFPFETRSIGDPARIRVLAFEDGEVLLVEDGSDGKGTEYPIDPESLADSDAIFAANWVDHPGVGDLIASLDAAGACLPIVVDPGRLGRVGEGRIREFGEALAAASAEVVVSANRAECRALAGTVSEEGGDLAGDGEDLEATLESARSALEVAAVVCHGEKAAAAATREGPHRLPTLQVEDVVLTTGAGDRFSAGLASALARDWEWERALALGNACSAYFVATGESGKAGELAEFVRNRR